MARLQLGILFLSLAALTGPAQGIEGDVIAASDFRSGAQNWTLQGSGWSSEGLQSEGDVIAAIDDPSNTAKTWYYAAPKAFLGGDKTLAYNGWLAFDFGHFEYESMGLSMMDGYDVLLYGKNKKMTLGLKGVFKSDGSRLSNSYAVRLEESFQPSGSAANWKLTNVVKAVDGKLVAKAPTQYEFIATLQSLTGISIRGSYYQGSEATWIKDVKILQGALNKGGDDGDIQTRIQGTLVNGSRATPVASSDTCCSSRTCVSNDKYEISFDRPGCMQAPDGYCCMSSPMSNTDTCTTYSRTFDKSKAAEIVGGTDHNEGRPFFLPGRVDRCRGAGTGQYGQSFSSCLDESAVASTATWDSGTKNQNMGVMAIPIKKPFIKDYYMSSVPRICSAATLTVEMHGDIANPKDSIKVYGEDEEYLGTIFGGNLTYMTEGQRPYDPTGAVTYCDGAYDAEVAGSGTNARNNDPHHPSGAIPQGKGFRGGRDDVVTPGVPGSEDTKCTPWSSQLYGKQPLSFEHSDSSPYKDSIAISQDRMMHYTADEQIKFTFRSVRDDSVQNQFSGTGSGGTTTFCSVARGATDCGTGACAGCDLDGKVIFRSIKLKFSAGVCYTKKLATDIRFEYLPTTHGPAPLTVGLQYTVPAGESGAPGGDAVLSVTVGADIFGLDKYISVYDASSNKIGDLFRKESMQGLRSHVSDDVMLRSGAFGAFDSPLPFHATTDCDTSSPITNAICTKADSRWTMGETFVNYTDSLRIPRATIAAMAVSGKVQLFLQAGTPNNAFSLGAEGSARISPLTLAYPLMHCFMKAMKKGSNFGIFLERPHAYYFKETGFPAPAGDVTLFIAASWQGHVRYVTRHAGAAIADKFSYDGVEDGLPVMRVDKDTVADLGTKWVYKNKDGRECCPATHQPGFANAQAVVSEYSSCLLGSCYEPNARSNDGSSEAAPAAGADSKVSVVGADGTFQFSLQKAGVGSAPWVSTSTHPVDGLYVGMTIILGAQLQAPATIVDGVGCADGLTWTLVFSGGGGTGAVGTWSAATQTVAVTITSFGSGYTSVPTITAAPSTVGNAHGCSTLPTFVGALQAAELANAGQERTIMTHTVDGLGESAITVDPVLPAVVTTDTYYRISADGVADFDMRNSKDGGTASGSVAVKLASGLACETRALETGTSPVRLSTTLIRLDAAASLAMDAYNGLTIKVYEAHSTSTTYTPVRNSYLISDYTGVLRGEFTVVTDLSTMTFDTPIDATTIATADIMVGLYVDIDIDGDPATSDDVQRRMITAWTGGAAATLDTALTLMPSVAVPGKVTSTYLIYYRTATVATMAAVTGLTTPALLLAPVALGDAAATGAVALDLNTITGRDAAVNYYAGLSVQVTEAGTTDEYQIIAIDAAGLAQLDRPTPRAYTTGAKIQIVTKYEIVKDLGEQCLQNTAIKMTYSLGNAKTVANDPGLLNTIYSAWDTTTGRLIAGYSNPQVVKSWVMKLAGDGYYSSIYPSAQTGAFPGSTLGVLLTGSATDTAMTVLDSTGVIVGMYLYITDGVLANPNEEIVLVTAINDLVFTVARAQLSTHAADHAVGAVVSGPAGFNKGQGTDQMAVEGGTNRPSSTDDDAYNGLYLTIEAGTGAGQTRMIDDYHGNSRTAYLDQPWSVIPDATSLYRIHFTAEVQAFDTTSNIAVATFPRPVKKGYLYKVLWFDCATEIAWADDFNHLMSNNPTGTATADLNPGGHASPIRQGLPMCAGQLGVRVPKQGPVTEYKTFEVLSTKYRAGSVSAGTSTTAFALDNRGETTSYGELVGRSITLTTFVSAVVKNAAGTTCTLPGTIYFSGGGGTGASATYTSTGTAINAVTLVTGGAFYSSRPTYTFSDPTCDATLTITVDNLAPGDATLAGNTATIMSSHPGVSSITQLEVLPALTVQPDNTWFYRIDPAKGVNKQTTVAGSAANGEYYSAYETDVVREEYPELVAQHKEWPHGYSYMKLHAGEDGEHIANLFLKDYTQYATDSYYTDSVTIPKEMFANYVRSQPNGVSGEFPFTLKTPPGRSNIEIHSIVIGYPVANKEDATSYDSTDIETKRSHSHGQAPFFHSSSAWTGADQEDRVAATHPRFQTHHYTSTCGNGVHDGGEYCDDGNAVDGDGCSSSCFLEPGWTCETISLGTPSVCAFGLQGARVPDMSVGCKMYACEGDVTWTAAYNIVGNVPLADRPLICSGTPRNTDGTYDKCMVPNTALYGKCTLCVTWDSSESSTDGLMEDSGIPGIDGSTIR